MKQILSSAALGLVFTTSSFAQEKATIPATKIEPAAVKEATVTAQDLERSSFGIGYQSGMQLGGVGLIPADFDSKSYLKGFLEGLASSELPYTDDELDEAMRALDAVLTQREQKISADNLAKEVAFLTENGKKEGIVTTESGLQYQILEKGGEKKYQVPEGTSKGMDMQSEFHLHYKGTLIDGTVFDQSPEGETVAFTLQVVPGFAEALQIMPIGAKWKLFIPAKHGYGERRNGAKLGGNSTLIFEVELKDIKKREMPQGMPFQMPPGALPPGHPPAGQ